MRDAGVPKGTYACFVTISASGVPQFPINPNRYFFGSPTGGSSTTIQGGATTGTYTLNVTFGPNTWSKANGFTVN